jgi:hypothetical protein
LQIAPALHASGRAAKTLEAVEDQVEPELELFLPGWTATTEGAASGADSGSATVG